MPRIMHTLTTGQLNDLSALFDNYCVLESLINAPGTPPESLGFLVERFNTQMDDFLEPHRKVHRHRR